MTITSEWPRLAAPRRRRVWPYVAVSMIGTFIAVVTLTVTIAAGQHDATLKAAPVIGAGVWQVPAEIRPGTYLTTAKGRCSWSHLRSLDPAVVKANGSIDAGQRGRIVVKRSDKGLELRGDCVWRAING